jgi:hypothetical protein
MHGMTTAAAVAGVVAFLAAAFVARFLPNQIRFGSAIPEHPHVDVEERSVS